jgi:ACS family pantothenate transporter-like MFS transporter
MFQSVKKAFVLNLETWKMAIDEKNVVLNESAAETASDPGVIQLKSQKKWTSYIWVTFDKSPQERRFLFKVDAAILTFASLGKCLMKPLTFS